jgi:hypothetical protein
VRFFPPVWSIKPTTHVTDTNNLVVSTLHGEGTRGPDHLNSADWCSIAPVDPTYKRSMRTAPLPPPRRKPTPSGPPRFDFFSRGLNQHSAGL